MRILFEFLARYKELFKSPIFWAALFYALFYYSIPDQVKFFQALLFICLVYLVWNNAYGLRKDPFVQLMWIVMLIQFISWLHVRFTFPEWATQFPKIDKMTKLFLFIPIAHLVARSHINPVAVLVVAFSGFILGCIVHGNGFAEIGRAFSGERVDFGIQNAQFTGMISGVIVITSLILGLHRLTARSSDKWKWILGIVFLCIGLFGAIVTQGRQTWLALLLSFSLTSMVAFVFYKVSRRTAIIALIAGMLFVVSIPLSKVLVRVNEAIETFQETQATEIIPDSSTGVRLQSWLESIEWIKARPFFGWSDEARMLVIQESDNMTQSVKDQFHHLHSSPIEILVCYGVVGFIAITMLYLLLLRIAFINREIVRDGGSWFIYTVAFVVFWFVINCFESYALYGRGVFIQVWVFAAIYSNYLRLKPQYYSDS